MRSLDGWGVAPDAERALLGAILASRGSVLGVALEAGIGEGAFVSSSNQVLWRRMAEMGAAGVAVDLIGLAERLRAEGELERVGGADYLSGLVDAVPTVAHAGDWIALVVGCWRRRRVVEACEDAAERARCAGEDGDPMSAAVGRILEVEDGGGRRSKAEVLGSARAMWDRAAEAGYSGVPMPWASVMAVTGGSPTGIMSLLAGRRNDGKSTMARNWVGFAGRSGIPASVILLEDSEERFWTQLAAGMWGIDATRYLEGEASVPEREAMEGLAGVCQGWPIEVYAGEPVAGDVCGWVAQDVARRKTRLVVGDNWTQLEPSASIRDPLERDRALSNAMARLAVRLDIHLCWLCHVTKENEHEQRNLRMGDVRGSGTLVDRARQVLALDPEDHRNPGVAWLLRVLKNNNGRVGDVPLHRQMSIGAWTETGRQVRLRSAVDVWREHQMMEAA